MNRLLDKGLVAPGGSFCQLHLTYSMLVMGWKELPGAYCRESPCDMFSSQAGH